MPIKEIFNQLKNDDNLEKRLVNIEKEIKRINTLDVHMKRILKLEGKLQSGATIPIKQNTVYKEQRTYERQAMNDRVEQKKQVQEMVEELLKTKTAHQSYELNILQEQLQLMQQEWTLMKEQVMKVESDNKQLTLEIKDLKEQLARKKEPKNNNPIVYQDIKVERMFIDQYEMNNNIAQLGVKDLSGSLNIGATYGTGIIPEELAEDYKETIGQLKKEKQRLQDEKTNVSAEGLETEPELETEIDIE